MRKVLTSLLMVAAVLSQAGVCKVVVAQNHGKSLPMAWTVSMLESYPDQDAAPPAVIEAFTSPLKAMQFDPQRPDSFTAEWNWLSEGKFSLVNTSGKTLNSVNVQISLYVGDSRKPKRQLEVRRGADTGFPGVTADTWIKPGETFEVEIPAQGNFELLLSAIAESQDQPARIVVSVSRACYDGLPDTIWRYGSLMYRDPSDPMRFYVRRDKQE